MFCVKGFSISASSNLLEPFCHNLLFSICKRFSFILIRGSLRFIGCGSKIPNGCSHLILILHSFLFIRAGPDMDYFSPQGHNINRFLGVLEVAL